MCCKNVKKLLWVGWEHSAIQWNKTLSGVTVITTFLSVCMYVCACDAVVYVCMCGVCEACFCFCCSSAFFRKFMGFRFRGLGLIIFRTLNRYRWWHHDICVLLLLLLSKYSIKRLLLYYQFIFNHNQNCMALVVLLLK